MTVRSEVAIEPAAAKPGLVAGTPALAARCSACSVRTLVVAAALAVPSAVGPVAGLPSRKAAVVVASAYLVAGIALNVAALAVDRMRSAGAATGTG